MPGVDSGMTAFFNMRGDWMEKDWGVLHIDTNRMWVGLTIKEPLGDECSQLSPEFIEQYLRENGITAGINREAITALVTQVEYEREVIVAQGKPPVNGQNGFFQYTVMLEDARSKPVVHADGSVDYYNSLKLAMVQEGDLIAVYVPPTPGEYGYTVFAEMLPPIKGKELRPLRGKGFCVSENGREYRAAYDGRIYRDDDKIIIDRIYIVKGDLDIEEGNIRFNGDVEVRGDVRSGLEIRTDGDIFVHGHVGSCTLIAGGNITIRKGVQGRRKCQITAGKDIACSFVERCSINAGGNVYADSILDSEVAAKQQVIVSSRKGLVLGGIVSGTQGIRAKEAGNEAGTATALQVGMVAEEMQRAAELVQQHHRVTEEVELLDRNLKLYDSLEGSRRTKETEATRMKILRAKVIKTTEQKKIAEQLVRLNEEIRRARLQAHVRISGAVYAGVRVNIGKAWYEVKDACKDVQFLYRQGEVVMLSGDEA